MLILARMWCNVKRKISSSVLSTVFSLVLRLPLTTPRKKRGKFFGGIVIVHWKQNKQARVLRLVNEFSFQVAKREEVLETREMEMIAADDLFGFKSVLELSAILRAVNFPSL